MKASFDPQFESRFNFLPDDSVVYASGALDDINTGARAGVVNRTHRVVRERAKVIQKRRIYVRSLLIPLAICSVMLILTCFAVWSGLYQYPSTEAASVDATAAATNDISNQLSAVLLWFVPVSTTLLATVLYKRSHKSASHEAL
jgi:hypothetical protein